MQELQGVTLARCADEALLKNAEILSEGEIISGDRERNSYFGSTLIAIDLLRSDIDLGPMYEDRELLKRMAHSSVSFRLRLMRLARREAERKCAPRNIGRIATDTEFRIEGDQFLVDINIECDFIEEQALGDESSGVAK